MKLKANSVGVEQAARQPRPLDRALAFLDLLLRRTALAVKGHDLLGWAQHVRDDEANARNQFSGMPLDLGRLAAASSKFSPDSESSRSTVARHAAVGRLAV